jgi:hypothetical protein
MHAQRKTHFEDDVQPDVRSHAAGEELRPAPMSSGFAKSWDRDDPTLVWTDSRSPSERLPLPELIELEAPRTAAVFLWSLTAATGLWAAVLFMRVLVMEAPVPQADTRARPRDMAARVVLAAEHTPAPSTPRTLDPRELSQTDSHAGAAEVQVVARESEPIVKPVSEAAAVGTSAPSSHSPTVKPGHLREADSARRSVARARSRASTKLAALHETATGTLRINSLPWAEIYLDGNFVGTTPQANLLLGAGRHRVKLVNQPMEMSKTFAVEIRSGKVLTKSMNLSP